jgi:hypothetical protein
MESGVADHIWLIEEGIDLLDRSARIAAEIENPAS